MILEKLTDNELIELYRHHKNENAFRILLNRYYDRIFYRLLGKCKNRDDAEDILQQVWMRVIKNIDKYQDQGKFSAYLSTIATNLLIDYWRRKGVDDSVTFEIEENSGKGITDSDLASQVPTPEDISVTHQQINHLVNVLIPELPCEQRIVYLLRHESEHWEDKDRLQWTHLAQLNGINVDQAWALFDEARKKISRGRNVLQMLILNSDIKKSLINEAIACEMSCEELLIFMVWTQAQRVSKHGKYTESNIAELIGIPVNTVKTRYRAATKRLAEGLQTFMA